VAGWVGLGVYSDGSSGWETLSGPTGGYLIGFAISAAVLGVLADRGWITQVPSAITGMLTALVITFVIGVLWLKNNLGLSGTEALELGLYPFVPGEVIKLYAAGIVLPHATNLARRARA
jgi:biotin transport system substrate-specific component